MVTRQLQVERRTGKVRRSETDVLPLCNAAKPMYTVFQKTCDHIFDDKLKYCPFTKIFGILITKSIGHRQVSLVSHLTYFLQLLYLGKLSRPIYHEFSFNDINCKTVIILLYLLIIQLTVYNRTTTKFIADDKVVYQRVR